jgi:hypothetical protein
LRLVASAERATSSALFSSILGFYGKEATCIILLKILRRHACCCREAGETPVLLYSPEVRGFPRTSIVMISVSWTRKNEQEEEGPPAPAMGGQSRLTILTFHQQKL